MFEDAFYLPDRSTQLPGGNLALRKVEREFEKYEDERMKEAEDISGRERTGNGERQFLEEASRSIDSQDLLSANMGRQSDPNAIDEGTRTRIRKAVESRAKVQSEKELAETKEKPPIAENPIFKKFKDGTLLPKKETPAPTRELPPFPSQEHCIGFWRVVSSPTGFESEGNADNLVLRVDGTTAAGPILDKETRQKASGGTWDLSGTADDATLRIRLVIPPKKERALVMQGRLQCASMTKDFSLTRGTFRIPELEERAARAETVQEDLLYCSGNVWIEDVVGSNRDEIGTFSLMKLNTSTDPSEFTITIPRPVRNQD
jgi:hypothetical protein